MNQGERRGHIGLTCLVSEKMKGCQRQFQDSCFLTMVLSLNSDRSTPGPSRFVCKMDTVVKKVNKTFFTRLLFRKEAEKGMQAVKTVLTSIEEKRTPMKTHCEPHAGPVQEKDPFPEKRSMGFRRVGAQQ